MFEALLLFHSNVLSSTSSSFFSVRRGADESWAVEAMAERSEEKEKRREAPCSSFSLFCSTMLLVDEKKNFHKKNGEEEKKRKPLLAFSKRQNEDADFFLSPCCPLLASSYDSNALERDNIVALPPWGTQCGEYRHDSPALKLREDLASAKRRRRRRRLLFASGAIPPLCAPALCIRFLMYDAVNDRCASVRNNSRERPHLLFLRPHFASTH